MAPEFGPVGLDDGTRFRLWAPAVAGVDLVVEGKSPVSMNCRPGGWHEATVHCGPGTLYRFRLPDGSVVPDPASRAQPFGVEGPSLIVDPAHYRWRSSEWCGQPWEKTILYELHVGLCGGFKGVEQRLPALADLGITAIELMPIAEFSGQRNWGYDGVFPFSPDSDYGSPDDLKHLVDRAHELGLMMFLDVVYNHFGPEGNFLPNYATEFFEADKPTPWGSAIDYRRDEVRRFFTENALYWLDEFRFDGLRLDAVHAISDSDWIVEMTAEVRSALADRQIHIVVENESNDAGLLRRGIDAQWNDDFHHAMHVLLTGETSSYYRDFADDTAGRLARCLKEGFAYQGEQSIHRPGRSRGVASADLPSASFVNFLQNHDQVGNRALGERLTELTDVAALKAAIALLFLCPSIPLMFMGEEHGSARPFLFFTDFKGDLADAVREGRRREFGGFPAFADPASRNAIPDPNALATFDSSRPDERTADADAWLALYQRLIAIRQHEIVPRLRGAVGISGVAIGSKAVEASWLLDDGALLTILCNLGSETIEHREPDGTMIWGQSFSNLPGHTTFAWIKPA